MKRQLCLTTALAVGALFLSGLSPAHAISVTFSQDTATLGLGSNSIPDFGVSGTVDQIPPTAVNVSGQNRNPWQDNSGNNLFTDRNYTSVRGDGGLPGGTAGFNISGTTLDIFWGSPDQYNSITFWTGLGGTGDSFTVTGGQLTPFPGLILGLGHDFVHFLSDVQFNSIVLFSGQPAFEFSDLTARCGSAECAPVAATPLPAALPLFASAFAGIGGLLGWRKRKAKRESLVPA